MYEFKPWRHWHKSMTSDLKTKYYAETNTSDVEKIKNRHNHNFEDEANNAFKDGILVKKNYCELSPFEEL